MNDKHHGGDKAPGRLRIRKSPRVTLEAEILMRRAGLNSYRISVHDLSPHGCKVEFVDRPALHERVWLKFDGLEVLEGAVCWVSGSDAGVEFEKPIHPAVFELLLTRLR